MCYKHLPVSKYPFPASLQDKHILFETVANSLMLYNISLHLSPQVVALLVGAQKRANHIPKKRPGNKASCILRIMSNRHEMRVGPFARESGYVRLKHAMQQTEQYIWLWIAIIQQLL